jgi:primosomal protein N' (replication factor Y) (superfamily II helicase)
MAEQAPPRSVAVLTEVAALDRPLDYRVPDGFSGPLEPGSRVRVDLHGRSVRGWILGPGSEEGRQLKVLTSSLGVGPPASVLDVARWASWRWYSTPARFLGPASPDRVVRSLPTRPDWPGLEAPEGVLGRLGAEAASSSVAALLRLGPCTDPLELVLGFLAGLGDRLAAGSALVLVPSVGYARRLCGRLARRGLPAVEARDAWEAVRAGWPIVVGTRAAALAPLPALSGVVVLDAEDERFTAEGAPTYSAVVVAAERARRAEAPFLAVATVPTPELVATLATSQVAPEVERTGWPRVAVADRRADDPRNGLLGGRLVEELRRALEAQPSGVAAACLLNRTGRARLLACASCDEIARCTACQAAMVLDEQLRCGRCGEVRPVVCAVCGATKLKLLRLGTSQLAAELEELLRVRVVEVTASSPEAIDPQARVVVGTEAVLHRLRRASLVAFLDLDHHLLAPRAGAEQRTLALLARAGRLLGSRTTPGAGLLLLQTRQPRHPVVEAATAGDPGPVLAADLALREELGFAPWRSFALLRGPGAEALARAAATGEVEASPLASERWVLAAPDHQLLCDALARAERPEGRVVVSVDPAEL